MQESILKEKLSKPVWTGNSKALRDADLLISKYSCVDFPIVISGEKGTGKSIAAKSIHNLSHRRESKYIERCCLRWQESEIVDKIKQDVSQSENGTLLLKNINALSVSSINQLRHFWETEYIENKITTRIICTLSSAHNPLFINQSSAPWLILQLPNLVQRKEDIRPLAKMLIKKYSAIKPLTLNEDCWVFLESHPWKDNVKELERTIALLTVMCDSEQVCKERLMNSIDNKIIHKQSVENQALTNITHIPAPQEVIEVDVKEEAIELNRSSDKLINLVLENRLSELPNQHPALIKSLSYTINNFSDRLSLESVANISYVSPSHLSYLYRKHLNVSFKQLLLMLRIESAKKMLKESTSRTITHISSEIGFHDLSHFEKTFKRFVGIRPLHYRNN